MWNGDRFTPNDNNELRRAIGAMLHNRPAALARYGPLREWNTERVQDFSGALFNYRFPGGQGAGEDDDITGWNTSAATDMTAMFEGCNTFNQPLRFDTRNVQQMLGMFHGCTAFNQPLAFNTSAVTSMTRMFMDCTTFNQPVHFDTHAVTDMDKMFARCSAFNQPLTFNTRACQNFRWLFANCYSFNQPLHKWNVQRPERFRVTARMFDNCNSFNSPVFAMSVDEYDASRLETTPLGQSADMQQALIIARRMADPAAQGRIISRASREAALVLGAPVHNPELAALRKRYAYEYRYRPDADDDMYRPRDNAVHRARDDDAVNRARDDADDGRNVRPRYESKDLTESF